MGECSPHLPESRGGDRLSDFVVKPSGLGVGRSVHQSLIGSASPRSRIFLRAQVGQMDDSTPPLLEKDSLRILRDALDRLEAGFAALPPMALTLTVLPAASELLSVVEITRRSFDSSEWKEHLLFS